MVEKFNKTPEESKDGLESIRGGVTLKKLMESTNALWLCNLDKLPGGNSDKYTIWDETIILKRERKEKNGKFEELRVSINKLLPGLGNHLTNRTSKYELVAEAVHLNGKDSILFTLHTDDWHGHVDEEVLIEKEVLTEVIPNFKKRLKELYDYERDQYKKKKERMQNLAYNDQNEADDTLWKLDDFYSA